MKCHNWRCNKDIEYGSDEACVYDGEIYCSDGCMLQYVEYGVPDYSSYSSVPDYSSYSSDEWDEIDSLCDAKDGTEITR